MVQSNRMHGVIKEGGFKPNIIPSYTKSEWYLRSLNKEGLDKLESDFYNFANAAALSTKCEVISNYLFIYYASWLGQSVVKDIRVKLFDHILDFKMKYYDKSSVGILITRTVTDKIGRASCRERV